MKTLYRLQVGDWIYYLEIINNNLEIVETHHKSDQVIQPSENLEIKRLIHA